MVAGFRIGAERATGTRKSITPTRREQATRIGSNFLSRHSCAHLRFHPFIQFAAVALPPPRLPHLSHPSSRRTSTISHTAKQFYGLSRSATRVLT
ncbi:hypothetical protein E2C01_075345 [Portunus trituberculatus]|uniref:Uncharacterized protein n=1 Tax=Portunus trituberculatus TaxID=210409 RepID=A0A5B7IGU7_PORTR|nr:hypothetical protein [Portunus trituberculatus]